MTLNELYHSSGKGGKDGENSRNLLKQTNWFTVNAVFDPRTGEALPQALSTFLAKIAKPTYDRTIHDRLWRITEHSRDSVERVFRALNENPRREQALLHIGAVRELDANSFIKLSNRPGRTIREKLKDKPYLYAVRRFQSVDLPENRLLKEFVTRLAELLEMRYVCLKEEEEDEILQKIQSWLLGNEAKNIARWENLPPNNTLLSHRDYRRIWDAWRWLQTLDEKINDDFLQFETRNSVMCFWLEYGQKYSGGQYRFADMPVYFDYEKFEIQPWIENLVFRKENEKVVRRHATKKISEPVCVDFTTLRPHYSTTSDISRGHKESWILSETCLWQHWEEKDKSVDIELFNSDAVFLHPNAITISSADLFFSKDNQDEHLDHAARAFTSKLHETFNNDTLIWLVPDFLNYFELKITSRNINAGFPKAEPLPRSIAAVFAQVDYSKIKNDGFPVVVVDTIGGITCVTKLIAVFDKKLSEQIPETRGYYWERCPPVIIARDDPDDTKVKNYKITTVDEKGNWSDKLQSEAPQFIDTNTLKNDKRIGQFAYCINLPESPVFGGIRLYDLQQKAGNIPLWRDNIPELSIKVIKDGRFQPHSLVSRNTVIEPIRGKPVSITVNNIFKLPAGWQFYKFPLLQGEKADEVGYSATLESPAFPLNTDTFCKLNLTFTYGADDPYCLKFEPLNNEFYPVQAKWQKNEGITDAPVPLYPTPLSWEDLKHWKDVQGHPVNLLEWLLDSLTKWNELIPNRTAMTVSGPWKQKRNEKGEIMYWFAFANTEKGQCYCNSKYFIDSFREGPNEAFPAGTKLFGNIQKNTRDGRLSAYEISATENITLSKETETRMLSFRNKSLQNRIPVIWADNRSLNDTDVPHEFKQKINELISMLSIRLPGKIFVDKFLPLFSCLHKDTTDDCIKWITQQIEDGQIYNIRAIGFALGDVTQKWQQDIVSKLLSPPTEKALRVFAYAIWHERHFIDRFTLTELELILNTLNKMLLQIKPCPPKRDEKDRWTVRNWVRATAEPLELLLGLLRTRESSIPEIRLILQPYRKIAKELAKQVENVTEIIVQSKVLLPSRVQLNIQKPEGDRTPDLLYALRLYLTGENSANAIYITGVSDNDDEND